jgi:hypothetical protein
LLYVRGNGGGTIHVRTSNHEYTLSGTLAAFERRLPVPWQRVNRSLLVAQYGPGVFRYARGANGLTSNYTTGSRDIGAGSISLIPQCSLYFRRFFFVQRL